MKLWFAIRGGGVIAREVPDDSVCIQVGAPCPDHPKRKIVNVSLVDEPWCRIGFRCGAHRRDEHPRHHPLPKRFYMRAGEKQIDHYVSGQLVKTEDL